MLITRKLASSVSAETSSASASPPAGSARRRHADGSEQQGDRGPDDRPSERRCRPRQPRHSATAARTDLRASSAPCRSVLRFVGRSGVDASRAGPATAPSSSSAPAGARHKLADARQRRARARDRARPAAAHLASSVIGPQAPGHRAGPRRRLLTQCRAAICRTLRGREGHDRMRCRDRNGGEIEQGLALGDAALARAKQPMID